MALGYIGGVNIDPRLHKITKQPNDIHSCRTRSQTCLQDPSPALGPTLSVHLLGWLSCYPEGIFTESILTEHPLRRAYRYNLDQGSKHGSMLQRLVYRLEIQERPGLSLVSFLIARQLLSCLLLIVVWTKTVLLAAEIEA